MNTFFRQFKITQKIPLALVAFIIFPVVIAIVSLSALKKVNHGGQNIYDNYFVSIVHLTDARKYSYEEFVWLKSHIISPDDKSMELAEKQISNASANLLASMQKFQNTLDLGPEAELFNSFMEKILELEKIKVDIIALSRVNRDIEADRITNTHYQTLFLSIQQSFQELFQTNVLGAEVLYDKNESTFNQTEIQVIIATIAVLLFAIFIGWILISTIQKPIEKMRTGIGQIAQSGNLTLSLPVEGQDEITELSKSFNAMTHSLSQAQSQLIQNEKMASLGSLVAGVAHEINTPIGVAVTMGSTFESNIQDFLKKLRTGKVRRTDAEVFEEEAKEGLDILLSALRKAASLIHNFKQVAIDQTSEERRQFNLDIVIDENISTLLHKIKNTNINYEHHVDASIEVNGYPGPFGQVLINLFNNAIIHGFDHKKEGTIAVRAEKKDSLILIQVSDNGDGISEDKLSHVFDPFFTTKIGQGGSGLGLHIAYNIIVSLMGGTITVESELGSGTCFTITIPEVSPNKEIQTE